MKILTGPRRGSILLVTFVAITVAALVATGLLLRADATQDVASVSFARIQARALAWSGVQAAVAKLSDQRSLLLAGDDPELFESFEVALGSSIGVVLIEPSDEGTGRVVSESARLPLNAVDAPSLSRLPGMSESSAAAIIGRRGRGFHSPESAMKGWQPSDDPSESAPSDLLEAADAARPRPEEWCTVFTFEPEIVGVSGGRVWPDAADLPRISLNGGWTSQVQDEARELLPEADFALAEAAFKPARRVTTATQLVRRLRQGGVPKERWGEWLDLFTPNADRFRSGVVDINRAPAEVLACLPGITPELAERLVSTRQSLDAAARASLSWPLDSGVLSEAQFEQAVGFFATRSLQYRLRVRAGIRPADADSRDPTSDEEPELSGTIVLEAVVDLSDARPRLSYLRDVTLAPWEGIRGSVVPREADLEPTGPPAAAPGRAPPISKTEPSVSAPAAASTGGSGAPARSVSLKPLQMENDLKIGGLNLGGEKPQAQEKTTGTDPAENLGQESPRTGASRPPADNRIGRWTFRRGRR